MAKTKSVTTVENVTTDTALQPPKEGALSRRDYLGEYGFVDFKGLCKMVPLSPRSLREAIKRKQIAHIRLPGARRLLFEPEAVRRSLTRFQLGGIE